jgi:hypothetical protein
MSALHGLPSKGMCSQDVRVRLVDPIDIQYVHTPSAPSSSATATVKSETAMEFIKRQHQRAQKMTQKAGLVELSSEWSEDSYIERPLQRIKH